MERGEVMLAGDRRLEFVESGPSDGMLFVFHHGTPGGAMQFAPMAQAASERGLRTVVYGRPGYGTSTPQHDRTVADAATDVAGLLTHFGAQTFVTAGWSGGGPHALACSALLGDACLATACIAGIAPHDADGIDWMEGMAPENVHEFGLALEGKHALVPFLEEFAGGVAEIRGENITEAFGELLPPVDKAEFTSEFAEFMAEGMRLTASSGVAGWRDDDLAFVRDWGFDLGDVRRVTVWQGSEDKMVPYGHGRWLAERLPGARANLREGEGHISVALGAFGEILDDMLSLAR